MPPPARPDRLRHAAVALLVGVSLAVAAGPPGFSISLSPGQVGQYVARFGQAAHDRLSGWQSFLATTRAETEPQRETALLLAVNRHFNRVRFLSDREHWGVEDYWATPAEFFATNGGDCEDYSLAKYYALKELGVPTARLRVTYVKSSKLNQAHMVLAYYATPQAEPLILDNLDDDVRPASQRPDLVPVYSFNDEDVLIAGRGRAGMPGQIRMWRELAVRLERETRI